VALVESSRFEEKNNKNLAFSVHFLDQISAKFDLRKIILATAMINWTQDVYSWRSNMLEQLYLIGFGAVIALGIYWLAMKWVTEEREGRPMGR